MAPVKHAFSAGVADGTNTALVRPSNWNADHTGECAGAVPVGCIVLWSGTVASIPANWHLCDGSSGTPDLRNKFVIGAVADYAGTAQATIGGTTAQTGGASSHGHSSHASVALSHAGFTPAAHGSTGLGHAGFTPSSHPSTALGHGAFTPSSHPSTALGHGGFTGSSHPSTALGHAGWTETTHPTVTGRGTVASTLVSVGSHQGIAASSHAALAHDGFAASSHAALAHDGVAATSHAALAHDGFAAYSHADLAHGGITVADQSLSALAHDTVASLDPFYALCYIQRTA